MRFGFTRRRRFGNRLTGTSRPRALGRSVITQAGCRTAHRLPPPLGEAPDGRRQRPHGVHAGGARPPPVVPSVQSRIITRSRGSTRHEPRLREVLFALREGQGDQSDRRARRRQGCAEDVGPAVMSQGETKRIATPFPLWSAIANTWPKNTGFEGSSCGGAAPRHFSYRDFKTPHGEGSTSEFVVRSVRGARGSPATEPGGNGSTGRPRRRRIAPCKFSAAPRKRNEERRGLSQSLHITWSPLVAISEHPTFDYRYRDCLKRRDAETEKMTWPSFTPFTLVRLRNAHTEVLLLHPHDASQ